jgi:2-methylthioadenine synthetase
MFSKLKKINANMSFSSDFIIGYPGETDKDFNESLDLLMEVKFIQTFSFIYSARPGTPSYNFKLNTLNDNKKKLAIFQKISNEIKNTYRKKLIGRKVKTLFENEMKEPNKYFGRDEYSNSVVVESEENLVGKIVEVKINNVNNQTLFGKKISIKKEREFAA